MAEKAKKAKEITHDYIWKKFKACERDKLKQLRKWFLYDLYLIGEQHLSRRSIYDVQSNYAIQQRAKSGPYPITNFVLENFEVILGKMVKYAPKPVVRPSTDDEDDKRAARIADMLLQYRHRKDEDDLKLISYYIMLLTYGTACRKVIWAENAGRIVPVPQFKKEKVEIMDYKCGMCGYNFSIELEECPKCGSANIEEIPTGKYNEVEVEGEPKYEPTGDVRTYVVSPKYLYMDPMARFDLPGRFMFERQVMHSSWAEREHGVKISKDEITKAAGKSDVDYILSQYDSGASKPDKELTEGNIPFYFYLEKPSDDYPDGLYAIVTEESLIHVSEDGIPYSDPKSAEKDFNYSFGFYRPVSDRFWGEGLVGSLISIQDQINTTDRHRWKFRKRLLPVRILAHSMSNVKPSYLEGDEGQWFKYDHRLGYPEPKYLNPPNMSNSELLDREINVTDMKKVSSAEDVVRGTDDASGRALNIKLENAEDRIRPNLTVIQRGEIKYQELKLITLQQYMQDGEMIGVVGDDGNYDVHEFKQSDIKGNFDVHIDMSTSLSRSFALRMQNIYDLTDRMFIDPTNPKTQFKVLRMLGLEDLMPDYSKVVKRALYENEQIKNGNYDKIEVRDFDDHKIHFNIHIQVYNSDMFMDWEDEKQKFMIDHLNGHHQQIQKQAEMEMEKMRYLNNMKGESGGNGLKGGMPLQNTSGQGAPAGLEGQPV